MSWLAVAVASVIGGFACSMGAGPYTNRDLVEGWVGMGVLIAVSGALAKVLS